ncbi:hypothetical protein CYMTET_38497 [Cymbomonas tetramitiformis]|uniref:Uncharacterized protein n=1 Tax=Cymbomonas tetramitiformis TaxID=36881 RepID=A0AAE0CE10_9CHLO|nr:hypothetical protein CYMTET_38497 [Cymbomonas tetramitiformis]|eukprot:gene16363-19421_t
MIYLLQLSNVYQHYHANRRALWIWFLSTYFLVMHLHSVVHTACDPQPTRSILNSVYHDLARQSHPDKVSPADSVSIDFVELQQTVDELKSNPLPCVNVATALEETVCNIAIARLPLESTCKREALVTLRENYTEWYIGVGCELTCLVLQCDDQVCQHTLHQDIDGGDNLLLSHAVFCVLAVLQGYCIVLGIFIFVICVRLVIRILLFPLRILRALAVRVLPASIGKMLTPPVQQVAPNSVSSANYEEDAVPSPPFHKGPLDPATQGEVAQQPDVARDKVASPSHPIIEGTSATAPQHTNAEQQVTAQEAGGTSHPSVNSDPLAQAPQATVQEIRDATQSDASPMDIGVSTVTPQGTYMYAQQTGPTQEQFEQLMLERPDLAWEVKEQIETQQLVAALRPAGHCPLLMITPWRCLEQGLNVLSLAACYKLYEQMSSKYTFFRDDWPSALLIGSFFVNVEVQWILTSTVVGRLRMHTAILSPSSWLATAFMLCGMWIAVARPLGHDILHLMPLMAADFSWFAYACRQCDLAKHHLAYCLSRGYYFANLLVFAPSLEFASDGEFTIGLAVLLGLARLWHATQRRRRASWCSLAAFVLEVAALTAMALAGGQAALWRGLLLEFACMLELHMLQMEKWRLISDVDACFKYD